MAPFDEVNWLALSNAKIHMNFHRRHTALSITELMAVTLVILVIISLLVPVINLVRDKSRMTRCMGNLTQLNLAFHQYLNEHKSYPARHSELTNELASYVSQQDLFMCPEDEEGVDDSYSAYFASRHHEDDESSLMVACPRHFGFEKSLNMTVGGGIYVATMMLIHKTHLTGDEEITAGETVANGAGIQFADVVTVVPTLDQPKRTSRKSCASHRKPSASAPTASNSA